jgi:hypothetical protein
MLVQADDKFVEKAMKPGDNMLNPLQTRFAIGARSSSATRPTAPATPATKPTSAPVAGDPWAAARSKKVTADFNETPLRDVCAALSQQTGITISLQGTFLNKPVTLRVKNDAEGAIPLQREAAQTTQAGAIIDWSRFQLPAEATTDYDQWRRLLLGCVRYNVGWLHATFPQDKQLGRPYCMLILASAAAPVTTSVTSSVYVPVASLKADGSKSEPLPFSITTFCA